MKKLSLEFILKKVLYITIAANLLMLSGCGSVDTVVEDVNDSEPIISTLETQVDSIGDNYRVMYEIFTGSFSDSDGDGTGDIRGIINRLDYLNDGNINSGESLGIQGLWLTPVFESPSYHKYDVEDYYKIDHRFGTEEDLKELIQSCHDRNVIVILDLVINHTSVKNSWFTKFNIAHQNGTIDDPYYDFYTWCTADNKTPNIRYSQIPGCSGEFYECNFSNDMPELNYDNEQVKEEVLKIAKYYLDLGIDGFRFDAIKYIYYGDNPKSVEFWDWYCSKLKEYKNEIYLVGECWDGDAVTLDYIKALNCFNFQIGQPEGKISEGVKGNISTYTNYVENYQNSVKSVNSDGMPISFISNHDMDRAAGYMTALGNKAQVAANLLILAPGSPFIYYGEEIGMKGTRGGDNTDANRRLAMLWGDGDTVKNPSGSTFDSAKQKNGTVAEQINDDKSIYNYYKKVIEVRNKYPEIGRGEYKAVNILKSAGGFEIEYNNSRLLLIHNVGEETVTIDMTEVSGLSQEYKTLLETIGMSDASFDGSILTIGTKTSVILQ